MDLRSEKSAIYGMSTGWRLKCKIKNNVFKKKINGPVGRVNTNNFKIDRPHFFVPRLLLARFQLLWENKLYDRASNFFINNVKKNKHLFNDMVINDFHEMMKKGFSIRENYEKDYVNKKQEIK